MKIYLGADHRGFELKEVLKKWLSKKGFLIFDFGTNSRDSVDYPDFAWPVAQKISKNKNSRGIVICGSGQGTAIVANKAKNVRAALVWTIKGAKETREHNDTNVLSLPADFVKASLAKKIVEMWLDTSFSNQARHKRRLNKIKKLENE
ncbi:ribose 5-phosphate isomerase B [Candidatus Berkelbacteria bacterium]|nr:ribose 5-phosphate isomerase B [Candidatus Berkelbacteria bacterium]